MIINTAQFEVTEEAIEECVAAITEFVAAIDQNEPGTIVYRSLQDVDRPNRFLDIFIFANEDAEKLHASSAATKRLAETLDPRTLAPVQYQKWRPVAMVDRM